MIGIPAVVVGAESFIAQIESTGYNRGVPVVRTAAYPGAFASDDTATQQYKARYILYDQIVTGLTTQIQQSEIDRIAVAVNTNAPAGSTALIGVPNGDGSYRTLTFAMRANGTYDATYNDSDTLSLAESAVELRWTENGETTSESFAKTDVAGVYSLTRQCAAGQYAFSVSVANVRYGSGTRIDNACDRLQLLALSNCTLRLTSTDYYTFRFDSRNSKLTLAKDVAKAGLCSGGTIENIAGVYVINPDGNGSTVEVSNLQTNPVFAVTMEGYVIPGAAFEGLAEGTSEGVFSLTLKPPMVAGVQCADAGGVSVSVESFDNLCYELKRAAEPNGDFVSVNCAGAEAIGTGKAVTLSDASLDRPTDKAFYRVDVSIPIQ